MVNVTARQWILKSLLNLRHGPGALVLPPPPAPQLTSISLAYPKDREKIKKYANGLVLFQQWYLPRLKYYNPGVKIDVDLTSTASTKCLITMTFEGTNRKALHEIAQNTLWRKRERQNPEATRDKGSSELQTGEANLMTDEAVLTTEGVKSGTERQTPVTDEASPITGEEKLAIAKARYMQSRANLATKTILQLPQGYEIVSKSQPSANPSAPSTVNPPLPIYTLIIRRSATGRKASEIWKMLTREKGGTVPQLSDEDRKLSEEIAAHKTQAEIDRERVKVVTARIKEEEAALAKAKKAVDEVSAGIA